MCSTFMTRPLFHKKEKKKKRKTSILCFNVKLLPQYLCSRSISVLCTLNRKYPYNYVLFKITFKLRFLYFYRIKAGYLVALGPVIIRYFVKQNPNGRTINLIIMLIFNIKPFCLFATYVYLPIGVALLQ